MRKKTHTDIISFLFTTSGTSEKDCCAYSAVKSDGGAALKLVYYVEGTGLAEVAFEKGPETLEALGRLVETLELDRWNGYAPFSLTGLDASGFTLDVRYADKSRIYASAYARRPKGYEEAFGALRRFFAQQAMER
jgi:hypothetical protein